MEVVEDIVIVGAGIAGLTTSLGLHRQGIGSLVLESSDNLRANGFAFTTWTNAWKALDAVGIGDSLRQKHGLIEGIVVASKISGQPPSEISCKAKGTNGEHEVRCVQRELLLESLERDLPSGTIRFSSKVVSIEESGFFKLVHLADGTILKTKVLIGCDGVNSVVSKYLGFKKPAFTGRSAIRGFAYFSESHDFGSKFLQFFGKGYRYGLLPCDDKKMYWFFTWRPSIEDKELDNPSKMKQFVLSKLVDLPDEARNIIEKTDLDSIISSPLRFRYPWELLWRQISKGNVCVAGDALHPMTPDIGQGGCSSLEDGVVLAKLIGNALLNKPCGDEDNNKEYKRIEKGLKEFSKQRKWRSIDLITTAYTVGFIQESDGKIMTFLRDKILSVFLAKMLLKKADFDCGKLSVC
ncbi:FAD_binding_3 domain-containing protein [Cephalotus follicularis]|uniref:FAD_binding_3 domain-containing protein n=1 Tax=Cephalotus follicularis TaxID=3775 RepID=A0A1Q3CAR8_CEPFO|nr:FAD_binding_3 domain-containing protein [Cephalotus follicularis]